MDGGVIATVVGSVLGFLASLLPFALDYFQRKSGKQSEPQPQPQTGEVTDGEYQGGGGEGAGDESIRADAPLMYKALDVLRSSVRPVLTYAFFVVFVYIKLMVLYQAMYVDHTKAVELLPLVWDEGTEALFAAVVAFWFGSRAISRRR